MRISFSLSLSLINLLHLPIFFFFLLCPQLPLVCPLWIILTSCSDLILHLAQFVSLFVLTLFIPSTSQQRSLLSRDQIKRRRIFSWSDQHLSDFFLKAMPPYLMFGTTFSHALLNPSLHTSEGVKKHSLFKYPFFLKATFYFSTFMAVVFWWVFSYCALLHSDSPSTSLPLRAHKALFTIIHRGTGAHCW